MQTIRLANRQYPATIIGQGSIPCLIVGLGTLTLKTLPDELQKLFTFYASDLYWHEDYQLSSPAQLTMAQICQDIQSMAEQLNLKKYVVLGHSNFGMVALETAKNDRNIQGVIMMAAAPAWNDEVIAFANQYFELHAAPERKTNDYQRRAHFDKIKTPDECDVSINSYIRDSARYWFNYEITDTTIQNLWSGIKASDAMFNHYFNILLPQFHLENDIEKINCPVLLLAGPYDFDSIPLELWQTHPAGKLLGNKLTTVVCPNSGHWPNLEDKDIFVQSIFKWVRANVQTINL